jgi:hypothetical protein
MLAVIVMASAAWSVAHAHDGPHITRGAPHPSAPDASRFTTTRTGQVQLPLPSEEDAFFFVVFGDRTGGPREGVKVLAEAVRETNLLEPDLVMTVGDLVQGYNQTPEWMEQMREYKRIMNGLLMPWFPVAGNHDIYWRGTGRPENEHEADYEMHFGPLWYAFEHKNCWFIALYSDEGDPETGEKNFNKPSCQRMSDEQFDWLAETLEQARDAQHVFIFLHHPRWLGNNYGDDWERVHNLLVDAGNITAVFAGHIHKMRYDGPRDGIEYLTLATVGGQQSGLAPEAGYLHQFHIVTVRRNQIAMASIPVGEVTDVRALTGTVSDETAQLAALRAAIDEPVRISSDGSASQIVSATITNPVSRPIDVTIAPTSADSRWFFAPDHNHATIKPGDSYTFRFRTERLPDSLDVAFRTPAMSLQMDYLALGLRYSIPESVSDLPMVADLPAPPRPVVEHALVLDGRDDCLRVPSELLKVPDGPLTLECWFKADAFGERTGLVAKTENSDYGFFVNNGTPSFSIFIGGSYVEAAADRPILQTDRWHHIAGVFDGSETRLYVDGRLIRTVKRAGPRRMNRFPLIIGADVDGQGQPMSYFDGMIDAVRLSTVARYEGETFTPKRRPRADADTVLLLNMDGLIGPWAFDESNAKAHPITIGGAEIQPVE